MKQEASQGTSENIYARFKAKKCVKQINGGCGPCGIAPPQTNPARTSPLTWFQFVIYLHTILPFDLRVDCHSTPSFLFPSIPQAYEGLWHPVSNPTANAGSQSTVRSHQHQRNTHLHTTSPTLCLGINPHRPGCFFVRVEFCLSPRGRMKSFYSNIISLG
jgi:hypothetical protein